MKAIDLYSGIGGWTLGFKMAGIDVVSSYEWWKDANDTHNKNFGTQHSEADIRKLNLQQDLPEPGEVDFVIGSPPCTQFSYANRGGNGDIADGLIDIYKFLEVVEYLQPKYWAMENVPRVANILERELADGGSLEKFGNLFNGIEVFDCSEFGVPQNRKRMIAGRLPFHLLNSYKSTTPRISLGDVINALDQDPVVDPIYGKILSQEELTDHIKEIPLSTEEARMNGDAKAYHPVYNKMSFPDKWDRPSRTITALCTRVSRESIIIKDHHNNLRRLTVRERGCVQSFPINYQYYSGSYGGKLKMIGNAIPPVLTFYIAQAMQEINVKDIKHPRETADQLINHEILPNIYEPEKRGAKYAWSRSFWLAIKGLRFGSGVRFELRNYPDKDLKTTDWNVNFFYGNSKDIKNKPLNYSLLKKIFDAFEMIDISGIDGFIESFVKYVESIDANNLQKHWSHQDKRGDGPIELIDSLGKYASILKKLIDEANLQASIKSFVKSELQDPASNFNKKLAENVEDIFVGMFLGSCFNSVMEGKQVQLKLPLSA